MCETYRLISLVHPSDEPGTSQPHPVSVRFVPHEKFEITIKHNTNMNAPHDLLQQMPGLSLFEIAGRLESPIEFFHNHFCRPKTGMVCEPADPPVMARAAMPVKRASAAIKKRSVKPVAPVSVTVGRVRILPRPIEFVLRAPKAKSVKLVADFTGWEKSPLEMTRDDKGVWGASVTLMPGEYAYRFIVDGEWWEDPLAYLKISNPFGTANSVKQVGQDIFCLHRRVQGSFFLSSFGGEGVCPRSILFSWHLNASH